MDQYVIQVDQTFLSANVRQHLLHPPFKRGRGIVQAKTKDLKLPQPSAGTKSPVFGLASRLRGTCQYPLRRSSEENQDEPDTKSRDSSMRGNGYESFLVTPFNGL